MTKRKRLTRDDPRPQDDLVRSIVEAMLRNEWAKGSVKDFAVSHNLTFYRARMYASEAARHIRLLRSWTVVVNEPAKQQEEHSNGSTKKAAVSKETPPAGGSRQFDGRVVFGNRR